MPEVYRFKNIKLVIRTNDHGPAHVHAIGPGAEAKIEIESGECFYARGFNQRDISRIEEAVLERKAKLMEVWNEFHE